MSELAQRLRLLQREAGRRDVCEVASRAEMALASPAEVEADEATGRGSQDAAASSAVPTRSNAPYPGRSEPIPHRQRFDTSPRTVREARAQLAALTNRSASSACVVSNHTGASHHPVTATSCIAPAATAPVTVRGEVSNRLSQPVSNATSNTATGNTRIAASSTIPATLRGEVSNRPPEPIGTDRATPPAPPLETLRRLLGFRPSPPRPPRAFDRNLPGSEIAPGVRLHEYPLPWPRSPEALDLSAFDHGTIDPTRLHFFDTETTGLAGGTGTRAFMLGLGAWHEGVFRVRQLTLTTLGGESAMLELFASWLAPDAVLVSYNGRSYDAPLLATRYRLARRRSPLPGLPHLDLLYPTRRRYRGVWENCRLATIERELLGIVRDDDLPGSEAPRAWREWLAGGSARDLRRVGEHNRQDLVSLAQLLLRLAQADAPALER